MITIFADTYYFLAVGSDRDEGHKRAVKFASGYIGRLLTTEWVLTEVGDALSLPEQRPRFLGLLELITDDENWNVIESSHELYQEGVSLFSKRPDKSWSLTDCISFRVMEENGVKEALTADHHFEQAGFKALLS